jgi:hypothetical protein
MHLEKALTVPLRDAGTTRAVQFEGVWTNQLGSTMDLRVSGAAVSGEYVSRVSGKSGGGEVRGDLVGYVAEDVISFVVKWRLGSASMTTWVGQVVPEDGEEILRTLWHLIRDIPDPEEQSGAWAAVLTGTDAFRRTSS